MISTAGPMALLSCSMVSKGDSPSFLAGRPMASVEESCDFHKERSLELYKNTPGGPMVESRSLMVL